ncbi:MAG: hypothetical protein KC636_20705, partial [Myxococcales bacterium]|nr:hypothetical protein [Myxococcales bacterium]
RHLVDHGYAVGVLRHPMPYGDLRRQEVQRFATLADLDRHECTIEEREEYRPYVVQGLTIYAGVDYTKVLAAAEQDVDLILWDGGNNDTSFIRAGLSIVVLDALRPGHETSYYPGETNLRLADVLVINKVAQAEPGAVERVRATITAVHPQAEVIESDLEVVADAADIRGRRALVVEDGPTTTHGGRPWGAGYWAARHCGAAEIIDPRPFAVGTLAAAYREYPHVGPVLPALGYSAAQRDDLAATIRAAAPEVVIDASPARLDSVLALDVPIVTVGYRFAQRAGPDLLQRALEFAAAGGRRGDAAR